MVTKKQLKKEDKIKESTTLTPADKRREIAAIPGRDVTANLRRNITEQNVRAAEAAPKPIAQGEGTPFFAQQGGTTITQQGLVDPETGLFPGQKTAPEEEQQAIEEVGGEFLEERGFFEDISNRPERTELDQPGGTAFAPIVGPIGNAFKNVAFNARDQFIANLSEEQRKELFGTLTEEEIRQANTIGGIRLKPSDMGVKTELELNTLIQDPVTAREVALQEIQKEVIKDGTTLNEKFGAVFEVIGSLDVFGVDVGALIEDPIGNSETIITNIKQIGTMGTNWREKGGTGKAGDPYVLFEQLETQEENLIRNEQRLALLISESATLQANGDLINLMETEILDAKTRLFDAKQSAALGIVAPAAEGNTFRTLNEVKNRRK